MVGTVRRGERGSERGEDLQVCVLLEDDLTLPDGLYLLRRWRLGNRQ